MLVARPIVLTSLVVAVCFLADSVDAGYIYRDLEYHAYADANGVRSVGSFTASSETNGGSPFALSTFAAVTTVGPDDFSPAALRVAAEMQYDGSNTVTGATRIRSSAAWLDRIFVRGPADEPPAIRINYAVDGSVSATPLGVGFGSSVYWGLILSTGAVATTIEDFRYTGDMPMNRLIDDRSLFDVVLRPTDIEGEYYGDIDLGIDIIMEQMGQPWNYDARVDFSHTFLLTGATANGMSLEDAGVTLEFQSQLERAAAVPEPSSITLLAIGACTIGLGAWRRRRRG